MDLKKKIQKQFGTHTLSSTHVLRQNLLNFKRKRKIKQKKTNKIKYLSFNEDHLNAAFTSSKSAEKQKRKHGEQSQPV